MFHPSLLQNNYFRFNQTNARLESIIFKFLMFVPGALRLIMWLNFWLIKCVLQFISKNNFYQAFMKLKTKITNFLIQFIIYDDSWLHKHKCYVIISFAHHQDILENLILPEMLRYAHINCIIQEKFSNPAKTFRFEGFNLIFIKVRGKTSRELEYLKLFEISI